MPTGYTADVANGKITDFTEYALQCARNFGACIMLRDEPLSGEIPEFEPSDYYDRSLVEAQVELAEFLAMSELQRRKLHADEHAKNVETADRGIAEKQAERDRYEAMLEKAKAFKSPSREHDNYTKFLVEQLESSIDFDCNTKYYDDLKKPVPFESWQSKKNEDLRKSVAYHQRALREEIERVEGRNKWVHQLKEALGVVPQVV